MILMMGISDQLKGRAHHVMTWYFKEHKNFCPLIYIKWVPACHPSITVPSLQVHGPVSDLLERGGQWATGMHRPGPKGRSTSFPSSSFMPSPTHPFMWVPVMWHALCNAGQDRRVPHGPGWVYSFKSEPWPAFCRFLALQASTPTISLLLPS